MQVVAAVRTHLSTTGHALEGEPGLLQRALLGEVGDVGRRLDAVDPALVQQFGESTLRDRTDASTAMRWHEADPDVHRLRPGGRPIPDGMGAHHADDLAIEFDEPTLEPDRVRLWITLTPVLERTRRVGEGVVERDGAECDVGPHGHSMEFDSGPREDVDVTNRLAQSTSPYLLQHADNPVDWWEWGSEAFEEAVRRDVPVFVSIGYSACHWCHVMAHESFEDDTIATLLNEKFVSIKVDREERPDVDAVYMEATVAMTGSGGWPMSVFVDHDGRPFFAGTYFPPEPRHQMASFPQLLQAVSEAWTQRRDEVLGAAQRIVTTLQDAVRVPDADAGDGLTDALLGDAVDALRRQFDQIHGGFGNAPKFPPSMALEFLLRYAATHDDDRGAMALSMTGHTLDRMARGGIYDQIGGGFARYSVDREWVVPHFEKMLYDNALLIRVYAHWWRLTAAPLAERVVRESVDFLLRELRTEHGAFAAALDADSEGVEGKFYAWTPAQITEALGESDAEWAMRLLEVTSAGTFEHGASTLQLPQDPDDRERWASVRLRLADVRAARVRPARDDKVVASWNGLAIAALADAGAIFGEPAWIDAAAACADFLIAVHLGGPDDDRLARTSRDGHVGASAGVLDDYGNVAEGLLALYEATADDAWLVFAGVCLDVAVQHFSGPDGTFFDTADDAESLVRRPQNLADNAEPSGWWSVTNALITYAAITGSSDHRTRADQALAYLPAVAVSGARAAGWALTAASAALDGPVEITVRGEASESLLEVVRRAISPGAVIRFEADGSGDVMLCRNFVCELPTQDPQVLARQLRLPNLPESG